MAEITCPLCGRANPAKSESCSSCGTPLKQSTTPLDPIKPGELPTKKSTSDLESTLPGWLRDARQAASDDTHQNAPGDDFTFNFGAPEPEKPAESSMPDFLKKAMAADNSPAAPVDFLAGLAQTSSDDDEEVPDWLSSLRGPTPPAPPAAAAPPPPAPPAPPPTATSSDWLAGFKDDPEPAAPLPAEQNMDWGFGSSQAFDFNNLDTEPEPPATGTSPDWLSSFGSSQPAVQDNSGFDSAPAASDSPDWLKALASSSPESAAPQPASPLPPAAGPAASDTPDWLSGLSAPEASAKTKDTPSSDWLSDFGQPAPAAETPDWLSGLSTPQTPTGQQPPAAESATSPDWLAEFSSPAASTPAPAAETPDWLAGLSTPQTPAGQQPPAAESATSPDWLAEFSSPAASTPAPAAETPDWLSGLSTPQTPAGQQPPAAESATSPDWLAEFSSPAASTPAPAAETPDWLAGLSTPQTPTGQQPPAAESATSPDWLAEFSSPAASTPAPAAETPDWLSGLSTPQTPAGQQPPAAESATSPDWLAEFSSPAASTPAPAAESADWLSGFGQAESAAPAEGMPDWLAGLQGTPAAQPAAGSETTLSFGLPGPGETPPSPLASMPDAGADDFNTMPDWLSESLGEKPAPPEEKPSARTPKAFQTGSLGEISLPAVSSDDMPDWLAGLGAVSTPGGAPAADAGTSQAAEADWLAGFNASQDQPVETPGSSQGGMPAGGLAQALDQPDGESLPGMGASSPFDQSMDSLLSMDMPDWLAGFKPADTPAISDGSDASAGEPDLAQTELPSWVQAMRPVETVIRQTQDDEQSEAEKSGPLAGLRNTLPGVSQFSIRKPRPYSIKIQASELQQAQSAMLEELLLAETTPLPLKAQVRMVPNRTLRWLVAGVLLLAILLPLVMGLFSGEAWLPRPTNVDIATNNFIIAVDALPANAPVLVATDYQAGFAGEMEAAAAPVLSHLMLKGARLAFVTSLPSGSLMAERLVAGQASHGYLPGEQYVFLGYLPGGAAGIRVFADSPAAVAGSNTANGDLWTTPALEGVSKLSDFAALVVLADNPDDARLWVEQAQPQLEGKPMLVVISAQAEPMIRPYYDSGQIQGLVTGLSGGMAYETYFSQSGAASSYWDAYGIGLVAAQLLILVGAGWSLVAGLRARQSRQGSEEA